MIRLLVFLLLVPSVLAHAGEEHVTDEQAQLHSYQTRAYYAGSVVLAILIGYFVSQLPRKKRKKDRFVRKLTLAALVILLLSAAVYTFFGAAITFIWVVSVLAIIFFLLYMSYREA